MYYLLSLLMGALISVMILVNGGLAGQHGMHAATVVVHIVGLPLIALLVWLRRERPFSNRQHWGLYLGGAIGVLNVLFANLAFGRISVSAILALGLFGQSVSGLIVDQYGWLGMPQHPFRKEKIIGLLIILGGIAVMLDNFELFAVLAAFGGGITVVVSRTINAKLAERTSVQISTFYNYVVGLLVAVPIFLLFGRGEPGLLNFGSVSMWYIYLGGAIGMVVVLLTNMTVAKISAFYLSLFLFVGQVFAGLLIDALILGVLSRQILAGGVLVALGLVVNLLLDRRAERV